MIENIPVELRELRQWVLWRLEDRGGKGAKVPYQVNGRKASTTEPTHWNTFEACQAAWASDPSRFSGIGLVFSGSDGLVGIDLDNCLDDRGEILPWACLLVETLEQFAYIEASPSGRGLKAWLRATNGPSKGQRFEVPGLPGSRVEVYSSGRYFTVTGWAWHLGQRVLSDGQACLESVLEWISEREAMASESEPGLVVQPLEVPSSSGATTAPMAQAARPEAMERARLYLLSCPPAISGCGGHSHTLATAGAVAIGFDLSEDEAFQVMAHWNETCQPPWPERDLRRKIREAIKTNRKERGYKLNESELYLGQAAQDVNLEGLLSRAVAIEPLPEPPTPKDWAEIQETFGDATSEQMVRVKALGARVVSFRDMMIGWELRDEMLRPRPAAGLELVLPEPPAGFLRDFTTWQLETAYKPQPVFALMGSICGLATLIGRKVKLADRYGTRPNVQAICLGETGIGKDHARKCILELFQASNSLELLASDEPASDAGLVKELATAGAGRLWMADEFGRFLATTSDAKASHLYGIKSQLLKLFSNAGNPRYVPKAYADARNNIVVQFPFLVLMATSTPGAVVNSLRPSDIEEGLIGRMLLVSGSPKVKQQTPKAAGLPSHLVEFASKWFQYQAGGGNTFGQVMGGHETEVAITKEASIALEVFQRDCDRSLELGGPNVLWSRAIEKAKQLAIVAACSRFDFRPWPPEVGEAEVLWAIGMVRAITDYMINLADSHLADSKRDSQVKAVLRVIREAGQKGLQRQLLYRHVKGLSSREIEEITGYLQTSGQIVLDSTLAQGKQGRPSVLYRAV
jgi:hypothetical protein